MKRRSAALVLLAGAACALAGAGSGVPAGAVLRGHDAASASGPGISERPGHEFVHVCRDGGAGGYEAFPDVCRLADGRLMAVFYAGYDHVSLPTARWPRGGRIDYVLSSDEGRTWTKARVLYDGPDDDRDPSIVQLPSGKLLCNFFSLRRKAGKAGAGGEWDGRGTWIVESSDLGRTWSAPRLVSADYYSSSPVRVLPDGRLMLGLYRQDGDKAWGAVAASDDEGTTWGPVVDIPNGGWKLDAETDVIALEDGRLLAVEREPATSMCSSVSADGGRTWSVSEPLGFPGHCPYLLRTSGGILVLAHRLPGTSLHYSYDDGRTWSENVSVDERIGAYPSMAELKDGSVLVVYYEEGRGSNIRARRFRVGPGGLDWLDLDDDAAYRRDDLPADSGVPPVRVSRDGNAWRLEGVRTKVLLDLETLRVVASTPSGTWTTRPSFDGDLRLGDASGRDRGAFRLASAARRSAGPYRTGFQTGIKVSLAGFSAVGGPEAAARLDLFVGLDGPDEDLVCRILADDGEFRVRELIWPASFEPDSFASTVVPFMQGMLLPRTWPRRIRLYDEMSYGRGLYMPWWGFAREGAAVLVLLETPDDAGCRFDHPAGGPTSIDVRWVHSLGRWSYPRVVRFAFLEKGGYVGLAKRYRRHVVESGRLVPLKEKIARNPLVGRLVGAPVVHTSILYHVQPQSSYYDKKDPARNHQLVTFDRRARELRALATLGVGRAYVHLDGWGFRGYDNLHPDILPPSPEAGGWDGLKSFGDACDALGFIFAIHDQYRDYYLDAATYNPRNAQVGENGRREFHSTWYGGTQTYLCPSLAPGYVARNHRAVLDHGVKLRGAYLDVFAVVPPDECYNPEHAVSRSECLKFRGACFDLVRSYGGVVSSEEPADWAVANLDLVHHGPFPLDPDPGSGPAMGIPVPLFDLVYHDAILLPWSLGKGAWGIPETDLGFLHGLGHAGLPYLSIAPSAAELAQVRTMCALNARVGLMELVGHEFLEGSYRRQRFTYADGTMVTIDLDAGTWGVSPKLEVPEIIR
jgi:hypothetical protein